MFSFVTLCCTIFATYFGLGDCWWCQSTSSITNWKFETVIETTIMSGIMSAAAKASSEMATHLISTDFEVFGKVQGVFFRKFTKAKGSTLGLRGWVQNTSKGTVVGQLEGSPDKVAEMKRWLQTEGSPKSRIAKAEFRNEQSIEKYNFTDFSVRK